MPALPPSVLFWVSVFWVPPFVSGSGMLVSIVGMVTGKVTGVVVGVVGVVVGTVVVGAVVLLVVGVVSVLFPLPQAAKDITTKSARSKVPILFIIHPPNLLM